VRKASHWSPPGWGDETYARSELRVSYCGAEFVRKVPNEVEVVRRSEKGRQDEKVGEERRVER
jgi:hypothetical protein